MYKLFQRLKAWERYIAMTAICFILVQVWMDLKLPAYMGQISLLVQSESTDLPEIVKSGGMMLLFASGSFIASCIAAMCITKFSTSFCGGLRSALFQKVLAFSLKETEHFSTASLLTRSTNDITQIQTILVMGMQVLVRAPIMAAGAMININSLVGGAWQWTAVTAIGVIVMTAFIIGCVALALPKQKQVQILTDDINRITRENLTGIEVIRAYNAELYTENKFHQINEALTGTNLFALRIMAFLSPTVQLFMNVLPISIYWIGAALIGSVGMINRTGLFAAMIEFAQYATRVVTAFVMPIMMISMLPRTMVSIKRVNEVLDTKPVIQDGEAEHGVKGQSGTIEFRQVSFNYPDDTKPALDHISFCAKQGQTIALIGATGSGKSSIVNLLLRFYDASQGEIFIDGVNVKEYDTKALRDKIGYCPQQSILFSGTVESNVTYGCEKSDITDSRLSDSITCAQADEFIENMERGVRSSIAQNGSNLSGGQKQRLTIARALMKQPEILIFDDSFSALDYKTERNLRQALKTNYLKTTKIIVAQRISTIRDADKILVIEKGHIVGDGTHEELMNTCEVYRQIAVSQTKEAIA
ncbi:MAG: ABC transporter ATP-binding protein [Lachnospiraceae bacterium]|nr:ABC transporter ATP-binding protein [Lachnospiraceae bacterium]